MNNWTLQMMQEKNQLIKEQANRITDLKGQLKKCGRERAWAERQLEKSVPLNILKESCRFRTRGVAFGCSHINGYRQCTKQNCPLLNNEYCN